MNSIDKNAVLVVPLIQGFLRVHVRPPGSGAFWSAAGTQECRSNGRSRHVSCPRVTAPLGRNRFFFLLENSCMCCSVADDFNVVLLCCIMTILDRWPGMGTLGRGRGTVRPLRTAVCGTRDKTVTRLTCSPSCVLRRFRGVRLLFLAIFPAGHLVLSAALSLMYAEA